MKLQTLHNNNSGIAFPAHNNNERKTVCQYSDNFIHVVVNYYFFFSSTYRELHTVRSYVYFSERFNVSDIAHNTMRFH